MRYSPLHCSLGLNEHVAMNGHLVFTQFDTVPNNDLLGEAEMFWVEVSFGPTKHQTGHHRVESLHTQGLCKVTRTRNA